jgi:hypothetical protein
VATANPNINGRRLTGHPLSDCGVRHQRFDRAISAREFGLSEQAVDLLVTGTAEKNNR